MSLYQKLSDFYWKNFGKFIAFYPPVSVSAIIIENKKILLVSNGEEYSLPGGVVERGKNLYDMLKKEIKEETGVYVKIISLLGIYSDPKGDPRIPRILIVYKCKKIGGKLRKSLEGNPEFVSINKIPKLKFRHDHKKIIQNALSGKKVIF
jgi:8-oxo-dGTP diphosphatase